MGVRMVLEDGVSHSVDSSENAFKQAAIGAVRSGESSLSRTSSVPPVSGDWEERRSLPLLLNAKCIAGHASIGIGGPEGG